MNDDDKSYLEQQNVLDIFDKLPPSHQKEYIKWLDEAKKEETRKRRLAKMVQMLKEKSRS